jgi:hypothetical protein
MILQTTDRPHSAISPSSFGRTAACTASYQLTRSGAQRVAGPDALLGTAAHAVLEWCLRSGRAPAAIEAVRVGDERIAVDDEMRAAVGAALDWVTENLRGRELLVEHQVALPWGRISGYLDVATADEPFVAVDFKFGYQTVAADTPQLGLYLLALLLERRRSIEGEGAATAVVLQPRAPAEPVRTHVWSFAALRDLRDLLILTLDRIRRSDFSYSVGPWCRWCPAAGACPALAATARDSVAAKLAAPELVAAGEFGAARLDAALELAPALEHWIRSIHKVAEAYLLEGGKLRSQKLVRKPRGGLTVAPREDPRAEIDVSATLKAALRSSVADGYRAAAMKSVTTPKPRAVK